MLGKTRLLYLGAVFLFCLYVAWIIGPYLRSVIIRDAAVTTWSRFAVAPIGGIIVSDLPLPGSRIGHDGAVAKIRNELLLEETHSVEETRDRMLLSYAKFAEAKSYLAELEALDRERVEAKELNADLYRAQLAAEIQRLQGRHSVTTERIGILQRIADRRQVLQARGTGSEASLDQALLPLAELRQQQAELEAELKIAQLRERNAKIDVFMNADGTAPGWVRQDQTALQIEINRIARDRDLADTEFREARQDLDRKQAIFENLAEVVVSAPPGSVVFDTRSSKDTTVLKGDKLLEWIDCSRLFVDVPVSDAELPLIAKGSRAVVVLEGESFERDARVELTRGSAAVLTRASLAALAKGRKPGSAQALLSLHQIGMSFETCPVGRAAFVEFPGVGLLDVIRARLRL